MRIETGDLAKLYIKALNSRDLPTLAKMYADNIILDEWGSKKYTGIDSVLSANEKMFEEMPDIDFTIWNITTNEFSAVVELIVTATKIKSLRVVDVIYFTLKEPHKIDTIRAYRGF